MPSNYIQMKSKAWVTFIGPVFLLVLLVDYQVCAKPQKKKPVNRDKSSEEDDLDDVSSEEESEFEFAQKILEQQFIKQSPGTNILNMVASFFKNQNPFGTGNTAYKSPEAPTTRKPRPSTSSTTTSQPNLMESFVQGFLSAGSSDINPPETKYPPKIINNYPSFLPKPSPTKMQSTEEKRIMGIEEAINQALGLEKEVRNEIERLEESTPTTPTPIPEKTTTDVYQFFFPPITTTTTQKPITTTEEVIELRTNPTFEDLEHLLSSLDRRIAERETSAKETTQLLLTSRKPIRLHTLRTEKPKRRQKPKTTEASIPELNINPNLPVPSNISPGSITSLIMSQVRNGNVQMFLLKNLIQFMESPVETIEAVECSIFQICDFNYFS